MSTYYATTQTVYERDGNRTLIPNVLLIEADSLVDAQEAAYDFVEAHYPAPGYFDYQVEAKELPGVQITDDATLIVLNVTEGYILAPPK